MCWLCNVRSMQFADEEREREAAREPDVSNPPNRERKADAGAGAPSVNAPAAISAPLSGTSGAGR